MYRKGELIMKNSRTALWNFVFAILLSAPLLIIMCGCSPKTRITSYSDPQFNFGNIQAVAVVLEDVKVNVRSDVVFAEIFTQTALEKKNFFLLQKEHIMEEDIPNPYYRTGPEGFLKIALTHCYLGSRTRFLPTSVGAYAKLVEPETGKVVWNMKYAYSSSKTGSSAPSMEEVMKIVAEKLVDSVPLTYTAPSSTMLDNWKNALYRHGAPSYGNAPVVGNGRSGEIATLRAELADLKENMASHDRNITPPYTGYETYEEKVSAPYFIHAASVQNREFAEQFIDKKTNDNTVRMTIFVDLGSKGRWYRLLIGRFESLDACNSYIRKSKQRGMIDKHAHPVKLPFSLLISSGQGLSASQGTVNALRRKHFLASLSPSAGKADTYDVLIGAYKSKKDAARDAKMLLQKGISAEIVSH